MSSTLKPSRHASRRIAALIEEAVHLRNGITNELINELCSNICAEDRANNFIGVYALDEIPAAYLKTRDNFAIIVNLASRSKHELLGHFVCIVANPAALIYIDSLGLPNMYAETRSLALLCRRPQFVQRTQLQTFDSQYCGLYAALFACYFNMPGRKLELSFQQKPAPQNDVKCVQFLRDLIDEIYKT